MRNTWLGMLVSCLVHGGVGLGVWGLVLVAQGETRPLVMLDLALLPPPEAVAVTPPAAPPQAVKVAAVTPEPAAPKPEVKPVSPPPPPPQPEPPKPNVANVPPPPAPVPLPAAPVAPPKLPETAPPVIAQLPAAPPVPAAVAASAAPALSPSAVTEPAATSGSRLTEGLPARVDSGISADDYAQIAACLRSSISYPRRAREMGWEGKVLVSFRLKTNGAVDEVRVVAGSGYRLLDDSAVMAVRRAAPFPPARREAELILPVQYSLR